VFNFGESSDAFGILKRLHAADALKKLQAVTRALAPAGGDRDTRLDETLSFGSNPGQLRMFSTMPSPPTEKPALVVVLHGCGQTAAGYDHGAGWSTLADRYGFALLMPEQQRSNNPNGCFNWFQPEDTQRGRGEAASIHQMVEQMVREKGIDPRRIFVTGLSAGGAMTSVMLACYPETFAAGAIIAGLPYGAAANVQQAFQSMFQCPLRPAKDWGDLVRAAAPLYKGPWPRVSVWHGNADKTVIPSNAGEILKQWIEIHGLSNAPTKEVTVDNYPRQVWLNDAGDELVESYTITHMAHGTPLATGEADFECGAVGPFLLEVGISSSFHIAKFFGLTRNGARPQRVTSALRQSHAPASELTQAPILHGEVLEDAASESRGPRPSRSRMDIGAVITKALEKAGLITRG
jgi:poly(hydroxyalkanoate) depolymerase family esterase